jgi:signal transduction histidine kinase
LKKDALTLTAISDRVKVFVGRLRRSYPGINIDVEERIETDQFFLSSQAFHLYRVIQEAVNNSLKHSRGKNILVKISSLDNWSIVVEDDGIGLQKGDGSPGGGNGLQNMKNRAEEAGWSIRWVPGQAGGTSVYILPTTN